MNKKLKQEYLKPISWVLSLDEDNYLLAASLAVQPGGGVPGHQGEIHVIDSQEEDGGDDDNLES